ncbi:uncharacterized protein LOC134719220 [Mytilus trossulus]|uniref:uncharacterized protein LOC134719220 n=1 Tax=Mytilus trossulus TaxID=6551 RepID=UPI00300740D0
MSAQLRQSARKRKNLPIVAAASAREKANQRVPDTMSVTAPQLPTVDTGTPFIPITSSTGTYPMLFSQTGAGIYTNTSTGPVDLKSTANTLLYSRVPLPDQRVCNTVNSQDPPEHSLGLSDWTVPWFKIRLQKNYSNIITSVKHDTIVDHLISCDVLTFGDCQKINACPSQEQKNRQLMDTLLHGNENGFTEFLNALRNDSAYTDLANRIASTEVTSTDRSNIQSCYNINKKEIWAECTRDNNPAAQKN